MIRSPIGEYYANQSFDMEDSGEMVSIWTQPHLD